MYIYTLSPETIKKLYSKKNYLHIGNIVIVVIIIVIIVVIVIIIVVVVIVIVVIVRSIDDVDHRT